jgi:hypothetical protein
MSHGVRIFNIQASAILVGTAICIGFLAVIFAEQGAVTRLKAIGCASAPVASSIAVRGRKRVGLMMAALANPVRP